VESALSPQLGATVSCCMCLAHQLGRVCTEFAQKETIKKIVIRKEHYFGAKKICSFSA